MSSITFVTWNVRGFGSQTKKVKVFNHLNKLQADICLLQETHLSESDYNKIKLSNYSHLFSAHYNSKQRGVCILINKKISFVHNTTITDPEGRFIIINISINNSPVTIGSLYGPNTDDPSFFQTFFSSISNFSNCPVIIAGDFNTVLDPTIDRCNSLGNKRIWKSAETIKQFMSDFGLGDSWRLQHPNSKEYTFFSPVHHSYSRIDFFLTSNSIISNISESKIHPIAISDHAPVTLQWNTTSQHKPTTRWRFNTSLLKDHDFDSYLKREWACFLELNDSPETSPSLLWETGKAVLRGKIISFSVYKKRKEKDQQAELEQKIKLLEDININNPTEETQNSLRKYKLKLNELINKHTQFLIHRLRQENFHHSNKSGKYLANQIKQNKEKATIPVIIDTAGKSTNSPEEINQTFEIFYSKLYSSEKDPDQKDIDSFLNNINLPQLSKHQINTLESPLSEHELFNALKLMPNNKAPGPDGFPAEFYKHFWSILSPLFIRMITESKQKSKLPDNMNTATISLLLKPNKDPTSPSSYRPISLINVDIKIITKALAHRIEKVTPSIIHPDQTGFIKGRLSSNNTRRLFNLMHYSSTQKTKTIIVTLDAEKAFDRVNWKFLFSTLERFGFGESFINWIKILYTSPSATVITNGLTSHIFTLQRGTRQGCPLSPSLFTIFIEPLAAAIRQNSYIKGIQTLNMHHKISLYADDILLYLQDPPSSLQETIKLIDSFSNISEYSINWSKSAILTLHSNSMDVTSQTPPIPLCTNYITYLGINVSPRLSELFGLNFSPLLKTINDDLHRWMNLPLSIMGRISVIKMTILPKLNYLFTMIPALPTLTWFKSLDSIITKFYWKNKTPRIKLSTLQKPKTQGGLEAPHLYHYFLANQLQNIYKWIHPNPSESTWLDVEQSVCKDINISDLPFYNQTIKKHNCFKTPTIATALTAWWKFHQITNTPLAPSKYTPIWNNPDFIVNKKPLNLRTWVDKGITQLQHILLNNNLAPFSHLVQKYGIGSNCFLEYLQIKSSIQSKIDTQTINLDLPPPISELINITSPKKLLSKIYKIISKSDNTLSLPSAKWESDLSITPNAAFWTQICKNITFMTKNANLQLIQYKVLHRSHLTGQKLFKMGFTAETCSHCTQNTPDTYLHAIWDCTSVKKFWENVTNSLSKFMGCHIPLSPSLCILGDISIINLNSTNSQLLLVALTIAKKTILMNWKSRNTIHITTWKNLLIEYISMENLSTSTQNSILELHPSWLSLLIS